MAACRILLLALISAASLEFGASRAVNISSVWLLPEEGFPVFYRYFRDRITWFEADAVCQFHHANLVTVDSSEQYDATRAYLKELDVVNNVWVGLKRSGSEGEFTWTDYKPLENGGYWQEQIPQTDNPVCAALDPAADFRWHPLSCGGPEVASFICQLDVPGWAQKEDGCMLTSLPSLTVSYLPDQGAVELISDCGLEGTRRIACKGQANREEMMKQLSCEGSTEGQTEATSSNTWDNELPTRHRRDTDVTVDMSSVQHIVPTTEGLTEVNSVEVTNDSPPAEEVKDSLAQATDETEVEVTSTQDLPQEMSAAEEPIKTAMDILTDEPVDQEIAASPQNLTSPLHQEDKALFDDNPVQFPLNSISRITSDEAGSSQEDKSSGERRQIAIQSKPIPPSLRGNSPFVEATLSPNKTDGSPEAVEQTTQKTVEKESHEVFRESRADLTLPEKIESNSVNFPPLSVYNVNHDRDPDESSSRVVQTDTAQINIELSTAIPITPSQTKKASHQDTSESKFFTRVVAEDTTVTTATPVLGSKSTSKPSIDNDFFVVTESPIVNSDVSKKLGTTSLLTQTPALQKKIEGAQTVDSTDDLNKSLVFSPDQEMADEADPEVPERPNRGRLLIRPQHHSFYPYFLNRVLG